MSFSLAARHRSGYKPPRAPSTPDYRGPASLVLIYLP